MSVLFSPVDIAGLTLANRIAVSPMCQYSARDGMPQDWHLVHVGGLALSGAGLVIMEATAVEAAGRISHGCLGLWNDRQGEAFASLLASIRSFSSAAIGVQLGHAGRRGSARDIASRSKREWLLPEEGAWTTHAPSALPMYDGWPAPQPLDEAGIARVIDAFAGAARRADAAGFDLVEIHGAHGYLIHQFLSPLTNRRSDRWGGDSEGRMRFALDVARAVRSAWPRHKPLGFRVNSRDWHPDGLGLEDALDLCARLKQEGVDYVVMSAGNLVADARIPPATPGHQVPFATAVKQRTGLTTMAVGMIVEPQLAETIVADGSADMVAIGRAILDNPRWPLHAAARLGVDVDYAPQFIRVRPNNWSGFTLAHPGVEVSPSTRQADTPASSVQGTAQTTV